MVKQFYAVSPLRHPLVVWESGVANARYRLCFISIVIETNQQLGEIKPPHKLWVETGSQFHWKQYALNSCVTLCKDLICLLISIEMTVHMLIPLLPPNIIHINSPWMLISFVPPLSITHLGSQKSQFLGLIRDSAYQEPKVLCAWVCFISFL